MTTNTERRKKKEEKQNYGYWLSTIKPPEMKYSETIKEMRVRFQKENPKAKITYWRGQWKIVFPLPKDFFRITSIKIIP